MNRKSLPHVWFVTLYTIPCHIFDERTHRKFAGQLILPQLDHLIRNIIDDSVTVVRANLSLLKLLIERWRGHFALQKRQVRIV